MIFSSLFRLVCVSGSVSLLGLSCGEDKPAPKPVIRPVRFHQVFSKGGNRDRSFSGTSKAALESKLSFKVKGTVDRVGVEVGDGVKPGNLIAELDPKDYRLQVEETEAALKSAEAQARKSQANRTRIQALWENGNASRHDLDAARASDESAGAQVRSVEKKLELAKSQLSYTRLTSPVEGSIAAVHVEVNENVTPGQPITLITSGSQLEVEVAIPDKLIAKIHEGDQVKIAFDALPDRTFPATVTEVGVAVTGLATTYPVIAKLNHSEPDCRPGMTADVTFRFESKERSERFFVPAVAVGEDRQGRFVFLVEPSEEGFGITQRRAVTRGELTSDGMEILEGLKDGERVVIAGISRVSDGQKVKLLE